MRRLLSVFQRSMPVSPCPGGGLSKHPQGVRTRQRNSRPMTFERTQTRIIHTPYTPLPLFRTLIPPPPLTLPTLALPTTANPTASPLRDERAFVCPQGRHGGDASQKCFQRHAQLARSPPSGPHIRQVSIKFRITARQPIAGRLDTSSTPANRRPAAQDSGA